MCTAEQRHSLTCFVIGIFLLICSARLSVGFTVRVPADLHLPALDESARNQFALFDSQTVSQGGLFDLSVTRLEQTTTPLRELTEVQLREYVQQSGYGTAWTAASVSYSGHSRSLVVDASAVELMYLWVESLGSPWPMAVRIFRHGELFFQDPPSEAVQASKESIESFAQMVVRRPRGLTVSDDLEDFRPGPFVNLTDAPVLGRLNDTRLGTLRVDCEEEDDLELNEAEATNMFRLAQRSDCIGGGISWTSDVTCQQYWLNCMYDGYEFPGEISWPGSNLTGGNGVACCPNRMCDDTRLRQCTALCSDICTFLRLRLSALNPNTTVSDLVKRLPYPPVDRDSIQALKLDVKRKAGRNEESSEETVWQLRGGTRGIESVIGDVTRRAENTLLPRPDTIELTLVIAAQIAGMLAIDSTRLYRTALGTSATLLYDGSHPSGLGTPRRLKVWGIGVGVLVSTIASTPGWITAGVLVYLEVWGGSIDARFRAVGWYSQELYDNTGEEVYLIRRVEAWLEMRTTNPVRPLYLILPIVMSFIEFFVEAQLIWMQYKAFRGGNVARPGLLAPRGLSDQSSSGSRETERSK